MRIHTINHWEGAPSTREILNRELDFPTSFKNEYNNAVNIILRASYELNANLKSSLALKLNLADESFHFSILQKGVNDNLDLLVAKINSDNLGDLITEFFFKSDLSTGDGVQNMILYLITRFGFDKRLTDFNCLDEREFGYLDYCRESSKTIPYLIEIIQVAATFLHIIDISQSYGAKAHRLNEVVIRKESLVKIGENKSKKISIICSRKQMELLGNSLINKGFFDLETRLSMFLEVFSFYENPGKTIKFPKEQMKKQAPIQWIRNANLFVYLFMRLAKEGLVVDSEWQKKISVGLFCNKNGKFFNQGYLSGAVHNISINSQIPRLSEVIDEIIESIL